MINGDVRREAQRKLQQQGVEAEPAEPSVCNRCLKPVNHLGMLPATHHGSSHGSGFLTDPRLDHCSWMRRRYHTELQSPEPGFWPGMLAYKRKLTVVGVAP